jgi:hypothetical protein
MMEVGKERQTMKQKNKYIDEWILIFQDTSSELCALECDILG